MKIALVNPVPTASVTGHAPHLGLAYLAGTLESESHEVIHFDASLNAKDELRTLREEGVELIGITATSFSILDAASMANPLRSACPEAKIVVGGPHVSVVQEKILEENEAFDFAVLGEGEQALSELARALEGGGGRGSFAGIEGLLFREDGGIVKNPPRSWNMKLDELPFPSFDKRLIDRYDEFPLISSRGCPYNCLYCASTFIWGRKWRPRSADNVVTEIGEAIQKYGWTEKPFCIIDDTFNLDLDRSQEFCDLLIERSLDIQYVVYGFRGDRVNEKLARSLKRSGCQVVGMGIESANPGVLENIRKAAKIDEIASGIRILRKADIPVLGQFMIGNPGDSLDTVKESFAFARRVGLDWVTFYLALPYPKTDLWTYVEENGRFLNTDFTSFHHYSDEPIFETPEFTKADRIKAYRMAQRFSHQRRLLFSIRRKLKRLYRREASLSDMLNVARRGITMVTDLLFSRSKKW